MTNLSLKTALDYIRRSPFQALAAVFVLTTTFFVATVLAVLVYSSSQLLSYFESRPQVIAFLKNEATPAQVAALQNKLVNDERVKDIHYVSKEDALEIYKKATAANPLLAELVSPSIFPASLEFSLKDLKFAQDLINEVKKEAIVDSVGFTASLGGETTLQSVVDRLRTITTYIRVGGGVFVGLLGLSSFLVLLVIVSMRVSGRKQEIEILNLVGATPAFIRNPILLEVEIYALSGVLVGWFLAFTLVLYLAPTLVSYFGQIPVLPQGALNLVELMGIILAGEIAFGALLAFLGASLAIKRARAGS